MNAYAGLTTLKARLSVTGTGDDGVLLSLLNSASRLIDRHCRRWFYVLSDTRYYRGGSSEYALPDDVLAVSTLKVDDDGDGVYDETYTEETDFYLKPFNTFPKTALEINPDGGYGDFGAGIKKAIEIAGTFGFGDGESGNPYTSVTTTAEELDTTETGVDVSSAANIEAGDTLLVESEQMYVESISSNTLTVKRGVNGTTAATHATSKTVYIYDYPAAVVEATLMTAGRLWKRKDTAYGSVSGGPEVGAINILAGLDPDVIAMLQPLVRGGISWGII